METIRKTIELYFNGNYQGKWEKVEFLGFSNGTLQFANEKGQLYHVIVSKNDSAIISPYEENKDVPF